MKKILIFVISLLFIFSSFVSATFNQFRYERSPKELLHDQWHDASQQMVYSIERARTNFYMYTTITSKQGKSMLKNIYKNVKKYGCKQCKENIRFAKKQMWAIQPTFKTLMNERNQTSTIRGFLNGIIIQIKSFIVLMPFPLSSVLLIIAFCLFVSFFYFPLIVIAFNDILNLNPLGIIGAIFDSIIFIFQICLAFIGIY